MVFGKHYFYLEQGNSSNTTAQSDNTASKETVTEVSSSSSGDSMTKEIDRYWNERLRYDTLQRSLFGR